MQNLFPRRDRKQNTGNELQRSSVGSESVSYTDLDVYKRQIQMRDYKVVQALLLFFATEYILINLIVDVLYGVINPRVRYE